MKSAVYVIIFGLLIVVMAVSCGKNQASSTKSFNRLPDVRLAHAAVLATAEGETPGLVSDGVLLAYEALNRHGLPTSVRDRSVLARPEALSQYKLLVASTLFGYHDADRRFSLTYMDDEPLTMLAHWISRGGILVAGENFGRNTRDGHDRILDDGRLQAGSWALGEAVGLTLVERDLNGQILEVDTTGFMRGIWNSVRRARLEQASYVLVPENSGYPHEVYPLAWWTDGAEKIPAAWCRRFGQGWMIYLTDFRLLHPLVDGGLSTPEEIDRFYALIARMAKGSGPDQSARLPMVSVEPWPNGHRAALAVTLNCNGDEPELVKVIGQLEDAAARLTVFARRLETLRSALPSDQAASLDLASSSSTFQSLVDMEVEEAREMIPETHFGSWLLHGFRFPRLAVSLPLLHCLDEYGYLYDSSLPVNHREYFGASLFPCEFPLHQDGRGLWQLNLLELGPIENDDWSFYGDTLRNQGQQAALYDSYLQRYWQQVFLPNRGLMVQIGDVRFEGSSDTCLAPVLHLIQQAKGDDAWITDLANAARFWTMRRQAEVNIWLDGGDASGRITAGGLDLAGLTVMLSESGGSTLRELKVESPDTAQRLQDGSWRLICGSSTETTFNLIIK